MAKLPQNLDTVPKVRLPRKALVNKRPAPPGAIDYREYVKRGAKDGEWSTLIDTPCILHDGNPGNPSVVYLHLKDYGINMERVVQGLHTVKFGTADRTDGMQSTSRVFGYEPRRVLRKDFCATTSLTNDYPEVNDLLCGCAEVCDLFYRLANPVRYAKHRQIADENETIRSWLLPGTSGKPTVFTSGIANKDNLLPYHFDRGNVEDVWSAMLVFKGGGVTGGYLAVPEYDAAFTLPDHSLFMFDGQKLLHGVTPFTLAPGAHRYSIVFYSLKGMWQCLTPGAELERYRTAKWDKQVRRSQTTPGTEPEEEE